MPITTTTVTAVGAGWGDGVHIVVRRCLLDCQGERFFAPTACRTSDETTAWAVAASKMSTYSELSRVKSNFLNGCIAQRNNSPFRAFAPSREDMFLG